ncbi:hypothetical protein [Gaetbulibacter aestuarii]|uniref:YD repeat-containing protein n=1 Tax=Gaetbulibacter aestuarii TaxID=1502358 RepID=A0ABW7MXC8_9FLAO
MKLIVLLFIFLSSASVGHPQKIKEIRSASSVQTYNEEGELIKEVSYPNADYSEEWTYEYSKDSLGRILTKTSSIFGTKFQTISYEYNDSLIITESIHQLTKFGITVSNVFKTYDKFGRIKTHSVIDSLQNDTIKTITHSYNSDTLTSTELTKKFKTIIKEYRTETYKYRSELLIYLKTGDTSRYEIELIYPENDEGIYKKLSWKMDNWSLNGISAPEYELFGQSGHALTTNTRRIKNEHGHVTRIIATTNRKKTIHDFTYEYY